MSVEDIIFVNSLTHVLCFCFILEESVTACNESTSHEAEQNDTEVIIQVGHVFPGTEGIWISHVVVTREFLAACNYR